jgi:hypothetical protein
VAWMVENRAMGGPHEAVAKALSYQLLHDAVGFGGFLSRVVLAESRFHWEAAGGARAFSRNPTPGKLGEGLDQGA